MAGGFVAGGRGMSDLRKAGLCNFVGVVGGGGSCGGVLRPSIVEKNDSSFV